MARVRRWIVVVLIALLVPVGIEARTAGRAEARSTVGYWLVGTDGGIFAFGSAAFLGSVGDVPLNQPIVGMAATPSGRGYWLVAADGGIFAFGDARFFGSMGGQPLNQPIVNVAPTPTGGGYWLLSADGGIFAFGDARFFGSAAAQRLPRPVVDIVSTPTGAGYWVVATNGTVYAFGDAPYLGGIDSQLAKRIHGIAATPSGRGYWLIGGDGGVFAFGDAGFHGAATGMATKRVVDLASSASGAGYYITTSEGHVMAFGDAVFYGGAQDLRLNQRIVAMVPATVDDPPVAADDFAAVKEGEQVVIDVLTNDRAPGGGPLRIVSVDKPRHGQATVVSRGVAYQPEKGFRGTDSFSYTVADQRGQTATGRVVVSVGALNSAVKAVDDEFTAQEGSPVRLPVLANDSLGRGVAEVRVVAEPAQGTATVETDWTVTYLPAAGFVGEDRFRYRLTDVDGKSSEATVRIKVFGADNRPLAVDDQVTVEIGKVTAIDVLGNDDHGGAGFHQIEFTHPDGSPHDIGHITTAAKGVAKRNDGKIRYTPPQTLPGERTDQFRYVFLTRDGRYSDPATVTITLTPRSENAGGTAQDQPEPAPGEAPRVAASPPRAETQGDPVEFVLVGRDPHGPVKFEVLDWPSPGKLTRTDPSADCSGSTRACAQRMTYWPEKDWSGRDSFTFIAKNPDGKESQPVTVEIVVNPSGGTRDTGDGEAAAAGVPFPPAWWPARRRR